MARGRLASCQQRSACGPISQLGELRRLAAARQSERRLLSIAAVLDGMDRGSMDRRSAELLSNRVFDAYEAIIDAACEARRKLVARPESLREESRFTLWLV